MLYRNTEEFVFDLDNNEDSLRREAMLTEFNEIGMDYEERIDGNFSFITLKKPDWKKV